MLYRGGSCYASLINEGVTTIFGYPGGAIMPVYDALMNYPRPNKAYTYPA